MFILLLLSSQDFHREAASQGLFRESVPLLLASIADYKN